MLVELAESIQGRGVEGRKGLLLLTDLLELGLELMDPLKPLG